MSRVFIIAEAGVNHNGDFDRALDMIDVAVDCGADAIKFQTFKTESVVSIGAKKAKYQEIETGEGGQYEMIKKLELTFEQHKELFKKCNERGIRFLSTAFDHESLYFLHEELGLDLLKIPSGEITNAPLLLSYANTGCDLILSTGMATIGEIEDALSVLAFGFVNGNRKKTISSRKEFRDALSSDVAKNLLKERITLLHCTTEYPAPINEINLNAMITLKNAFGLDIGYSDHSEGIFVSVAAVSLGAKIVEKHFTMDKNLSGPDHRSSLEPSELKEMIDGIRMIENSFGDGIKVPSVSELCNRDVARKSIVASKQIKKGQFFTEENISVKRPGTGVSPMEYWDMLGKIANKNYESDQLIEK